MRLLIDTDPGVDDAIAILMALTAPQAEVVGLTTLGGNVPRARATRNALALLQAAGRTDIPVAQGAARPRSGRFRPSMSFHGPGGLSVRLPDPTQGVAKETAIEFLRQTIGAEKGKPTVVALGPLTNFSRLEERHPGTLSEAEKIVIMGGAVETRGNVTPMAEFNFHSDPLAAAHVLGLGVPMTLADLAGCRQVGISREQSEGLTEGTPIGRLALRILLGWFRRDPGRSRFEFYDPLAIALALEPEVATVRRLSLEVGTAPGDHWGETTVKVTTVKDGPGQVLLAGQVSEARFFSLLERLFEWQGL